MRDRGERWCRNNWQASIIIRPKALTRSRRQCYTMTQRSSPRRLFCFCFNHSILFKGTNSHEALAMAKKALNQQQVSSSDQGSKPETLRPSGMGQTARQLYKSKEIPREKVTRKPLPTSRQKRR